MEGSKKIILATPSAIISRGFERILADAGGFSVDAIFPDLGTSTLNRIRSIAPDALIVDPTIAGTMTSDILKGVFADGIPVIGIGAEGIRQSAGNLSLYDSPKATVQKIRAVIGATPAAAKSEEEELSAREKEILVSVAKGLQNKEIADKYNISVYTVITHRKNITRKTGIKTVAGLTVYALLNGLIDMGQVE